MRNNQHRASEGKHLRRGANGDGTYVIDSDEELNAATVSNISFISVSIRSSGQELKVLSCRSYMEPYPFMLYHIVLVKYRQCKYKYIESISCIK